jgi:2-methylcitrate dehydratase
VLFKISYPAEFHAQTAVECAMALHPQVKDRLSSIERIVIETQEPGVRIIDKVGPLANAADRDHCLQYMVAVALLHGRLTADDYEDEAAADPRIDVLRGLMHVVEDERYSKDYLDPEKRSIANALQVFFKDGSATARVEIEYPLGHRRRRSEGIPLLLEKFRANASTRFSPARVTEIETLCCDLPRLEATPVDELMGLFLPESGSGEPESGSGELERMRGRS